jgi:hypothetical protein
LQQTGRIMGVFARLHPKLIATNLAEWRAIRHKSGRWPIFLIVSYLLYLTAMPSGVLLLIWWGFTRNWTTARVIVLGVLIFVPFEWVWQNLQKRNPVRSSAESSG